MESSFKYIYILLALNKFIIIIIIIITIIIIIIIIIIIRFSVKPAIRSLPHPHRSIWRYTLFRALRCVFPINFSFNSKDVTHATVIYDSQTITIGPITFLCLQ